VGEKQREELGFCKSSPLSHALRHTAVERMQDVFYLANLGVLTKCFMLRQQIRQLLRNTCTLRQITANDGRASGHTGKIRRDRERVTGLYLRPCPPQGGPKARRAVLTVQDSVCIAASRNRSSADACLRNIQVTYHYACLRHKSTQWHIHLAHLPHGADLSVQLAHLSHKSSSAASPWPSLAGAYDTLRNVSLAWPHSASKACCKCWAATSYCGNGSTTPGVGNVSSSSRWVRVSSSANGRMVHHERHERAEKKVACVATRVAHVALSASWASWAMSHKRRRRDHAKR
jgi:hypothetical protein